MYPTPVPIWVLKRFGWTGENNINLFFLRLNFIGIYHLKPCQFDFISNIVWFNKLRILIGRQLKRNLFIILLTTLRMFKEIPQFRWLRIFANKFALCFILMDQIYNLCIGMMVRRNLKGHFCLIFLVIINLSGEQSFLASFWGF